MKLTPREETLAKLNAAIDDEGYIDPNFLLPGHSVEAYADTGEGCHSKGFITQNGGNWYFQDEASACLSSLYEIKSWYPKFGPTLVFKEK